jgi:putative sterol carrier protein
MAEEQDLRQLADGSDDEVADRIRTAGTDATLDLIFDGMQERFKPESARNVEGEIQWQISDGNDEYPYVIQITNGSAETRRGTTESPRVTLSTDVASFAKLMAGKVQGPALYMGGKLKLQGDMMLAQRLTTFFEPL